MHMYCNAQPLENETASLVIPWLVFVLLTDTVRPPVASPSLESMPVDAYSSEADYPAQETKKK